jgi:pimeloyl-ACP methyl ester carboxylesterase
MPQMLEHDVATHDGRVLKVREQGDRGGLPVLVHNGMPNSRLLSHRVVASAQRGGIRLISYDRPGYGGSTRQPGRSVAGCASDVADIAAALGVNRLAVWGISAGGPHAIACAALLPDLVGSVAVLASSAPWGADGLDYFSGMGELNVQDISQTLEDPVAARARCERDRVEMLTHTLPELMDFLKTLLAPVDAAVLTDDLGQHLIDSIRSGMATSSDGWWDDELAMLAPWGFEFGVIRTPVLLLHGRHDRFVPFSHGEWLARSIPGVEAKLTDDDGHLTLTTRHLDEVHTWLLGRL